MKKIYLLLVLLSITFIGFGQTTLSAGDIAIFGVNGDNPDDFGFVLLVDIDAGTEIRFTDSGWKSDNTFRGGEGAVKYTAPSALPAGTEITYQGNNGDFVADNDATVGNNGFNLSGSGDQVFAFQGASGSPTFIYALQYNSNVWQSDATASTNSAIPQGLTNGTNAVAVGAGSGAGDEYDNAGYDKSTMSGTAAQILAEVSNNANWTGNNSTRYDLTTYDFTVSGGSGGSGPDNPSSLVAASVSTSEIDLSWAQNGDGDDVMVAWSSDGTFGTPANGTSYATGNTITGGGTVIYNGSGTSFSHTGLSAGTQYYYKAWSVDGSTNYSSGVTDDATTFKVEPSNHVANFAAGQAGASTIPLTWSDNDGTVAADNFLVMISTSPTFTNPVDGTPQSDDTDLSDGSGQVNVAHGTEAYRWDGLVPNTQYYFAIYPYTNSGTAINYKTDGTVPTASASTSVVFGAPDLFISEYIEGSGNNKALEIYNGTGAAVDLSAYQVWKISNGGNWAESTLGLSGTLANGDVYVIYNSNAGAEIVAVGDVAWGSATWNGDDAVGLAKDDGTGTFVLIDAVGEDGSDPGSGWNVAGVTNATANHTLVRKSSILSPNTDWAASAGTTTENSEWVVYDNNDLTHIGYHITNAPPVPLSDWAIALFALMVLVFIGVKNRIG